MLDGPSLGLLDMGVLEWRLGLPARLSSLRCGANEAVTGYLWMTRVAV